MTCCNSLNNRRRACYRIAGCKDTGFRCLHGEMVNLECSPCCKINIFFSYDGLRISPLADGRDDHVAFNHKLAAFNRNRPSSSALISRSQLIFDTLNSHYPAPLLNRFNGRSKVNKLNPLVYCSLNLFCICRHLMFSSSINNNDVFGTGSYGRPGGIHGNIAAADNRYFWFGLFCSFKIHLAQKRNSIHDAGNIFILDVHFNRKMSADPQEYGIETLVF